MASETVSYDILVAAAAACPGPAATLPFRTTVLPLLRRWRAPAGEPGASGLGTALAQVDVGRSSAVFVQLAADALNLAQTDEQYARALEALRAAAAGVELEQLAAAPEVVRRLAEAAGRAATASGDHARMCELLLALVERLAGLMRAEAAGGGARKAAGKAAWAGEVLGSGVDRGVRLTPLHVECLKQCLLGRRREQYERVAAAAAAGEARFDSLGTMVAAPRGRAVMEYSLYAGMVCVGAGDVARAARLWTAVFALPSKHASAIQIAAYKRLVLAELELGGRRAQLPGCFAAAHARTVESQAAAYGALADAFAARSMAGAVERLAAMRATLVADGNAGLGARVMQAAPAHFVRRVGRAYARVTVGRLVDLTGFRAHPLAAGGGDPHERLAQYVREMGDPAVALLDAGPAATAAPRDLVVCFADPAATAAAALPPAERARREELWAGRLAAKAREADGLRARLDGIDRHLALTKEHVTSMRDQPATS